MLTLLAICLVVFFSVGIILWAGTLGLQGYIYSEPTTQLYWRAPAVGAVMAGFLGLWCLLDYRGIDPKANDIPYDTIFRFSPVEVRDLDQFVSVMSYKSAKSPEENEKIVYKRHATAMGEEYLDPQGLPWHRDNTRGIVEAILVDDNGQEQVFKPKLVERPNPNNPKAPKKKYFLKGSEQFPGYFQVNGRRRMEQLGQVRVFRWGLFAVNLLLNAIHLGLWFVCFWLLLRFQWLHALGLAVLLWLVTTLVALPMLLGETQKLARKRAAVVLLPGRSIGSEISLLTGKAKNGFV